MLLRAVVSAKGRVNVGRAQEERQRPRDAAREKHVGTIDFVGVAEAQRPGLHGGVMNGWIAEPKRAGVSVFLNVFEPKQL